MLSITLDWLQHYRILFSQARSFHCFALLVLCMMGKLHTPCLSGLVSELGLAACFYHRFLRLIESLSGSPVALEKVHVEQTVKKFSSDNGLFFIIDSMINAKEGRRMPGVSTLRQTSSSNSKKEFVMGHDVENIALLVGKDSESFAVPLLSYVRNGAVHSNRNTRTCLDNLCEKLARHPCLRGGTAIADCYYCSGLHARVLKEELDISIITSAKSNAVAFQKPVAQSIQVRGRPRKYGQKLLLRNIGAEREPDCSFASKANGVTHAYECWEERLFWKSYNEYVRFVRVRRDDKHEIVLVTNNDNLSVEKVVCLYACRWRIEEHFKDNKQHMEFGGYRFWTKACPRAKMGRKVHTHRMDPERRQKIQQKERQYLIHLTLTNIATTCLHMIRLEKGNQVWRSFPGWLRSLRPGILPSIRVCKESFKYELLEFLWGSGRSHVLQKFVQSNNPCTKQNASKRHRKLAS